jgi:translation elongation factor EF-G
MCFRYYIYIFKVTTSETTSLNILNMKLKYGPVIKHRVVPEKNENQVKLKKRLKTIKHKSSSSIKNLKIKHTYN